MTGVRHAPTVSPTIRPAAAPDEAALLALDVATWSPDVTPAPRPAPDKRFFRERYRPEDVLVVEVDGRVGGYVSLARPTDLDSNAHVLEITGLAVDPLLQRRGLARRLLDAAATRAADLGARRLRLRVLGPNAPARALYERGGFTVDGVLRGEFLLDGRYVDDVLMSRELTT